MTDEMMYYLDAQALRLFARKGLEGGPKVPQAGIANGVKVRRIMQITRDLARQPMENLRILDLGCGEGCYAIEAGLRGATVLALDARRQRMADGAAVAERHGIRNVQFVQEDVRQVRRETHGSFDVVFFLGMMYHLDAPDVFTVLENIYDLCTGLLVVDTRISPMSECQVDWRNRTYRGSRQREHEDQDTAETRRSRVLKSIDNTFSFHFTRESGVRVLHDVGFTSVYECHIPLEPGKAEDRITLAAVKGLPVLISTYPWVNEKSEDEIGKTLRSHGEPVSQIATLE